MRSRATIPPMQQVTFGTYEVTVGVLEQQDPRSPVAIVLPAMGVPASYYTAFLELLHAEGLTVVVADARGQGTSRPRTQRGARFGYQDLVDDVDTLVRRVEERYPEAPRYLLGHSLGGHLAMLHAAANPGRVRGVALLASGSIWFRAFGWQAPFLLVGTQLLAATAALLRYWPGHRLGFAGCQPTAVMRDWARQSRSGRWLLSNTEVDYERALRELRIPLLTVSMEADVFSPRPAVEHLAGKAPAAVRTQHHYGHADAGDDRELGHFKWVRRSAGLARWIREWITASETAAEPDAAGSDVG